MDNCHELEEKRPPEDSVAANVEACNFKHQYLLALVIPRSTGYLQVDTSDGSG
jgi:hypothetical protein